MAGDEGIAATAGTTVREGARRLAVAAAGMGLLALAAGAYAGDVVTTPDGYRFVEDFRWSGNHAATINAGQGTTVWWDEDDWDARCGAPFIAVQSPIDDDGITMQNTFHVDVHRAASADPANGVLDNSVYAVGGVPGDPGVGIMHLDYQDLCGARLRNPMRIAPARPGVVTFYAPLFNTTGHWFEIAITPADALVGSEHTSVPSVDEGLPFPGSTASQPGPGLDAAADSLNVIAFGTDDYACRPGPGWRTRFGVSRTLGGVRTHHVNEASGPDDYVPSDPAQANTLVEWRVEFGAEHVSTAFDPEDDGSFVLLESFDVAVPWPLVHVHLVAVAYQSSHHPDEECNLGHLRELQWRDVAVEPVAYARTAVFPKNDGTAQLPKSLGFAAHDLRDIQRFGADVAGAPQPNATAYTYHHPGRYCRDPGFPCFGSEVAATLAFELPAERLDGLASALLVADLKDAADPALHPSVVAALNGRALGRLPEHDAVLPGAGDWGDWVRRALPIPADALQAGANTLALALEPGAYVDRIELELRYGLAPGDAVFRDGYEGDASRAADAQRAWRHPDPGSLALARPLHPVGAGRALFHQCAE